MQSEDKKFYKNTASLYIMNFAKIIFPMLTLPYLTRILTKDIYGVVIYVKAWVVYVQLILDFGFLLYSTKEITISKNNIGKIEQILGDTIVEKFILSLGAFAIYILGLLFVPIMRDNAQFCLLLFFSSFLTIFIFDFMYRGIEKMHLIAIPFIVSKTVTTILTFVLVNGDNDLNIIAWLDVIAHFISVIFSVFYIKKMKIHISFTNMHKWVNDLKQSGIYFISNFATTIFGALTTVISGLYLSLAEIACWGLCFQILSVFKAMYNPITNSLYPRMIREKDISIVKKICTLMLAPIFLVSCIIFYGAELILFFIGGDKYIVAAPILRFLIPAIVASFFSMIYGWPVLGAIGRIKETTSTTVMASIIQLICLFFMIIMNRFSLIGLAICCSISEISLFVSRYLLYLNSKDLFLKK